MSLRCEKHVFFVSPSAFVEDDNSAPESKDVEQFMIRVIPPFAWRCPACKVESINEKTSSLLP